VPCFRRFLTGARAPIIGLRYGLSRDFARCASSASAILRGSSLDYVVAGSVSGRSFAPGARGSALLAP